MNETTQAVASVRDLRVAFATATGWREVVRGVSLRIEPGERVALVGESGSGKTMLGLSLLGLLPEHARVTGSVQISGTELVGTAEPALQRMRGKDTAMVFQDPLTSLNPVRTIGSQLIEAVRRHQRIGKRAAADAVVATLSAVGVPAPADRMSAYPHQLSGGLRQRVVIALALVNRPSLIIADEPTTALDATIQAQILDVLRTTLGDTSLLLITHDLAVAAEVCDRVLVAYAGKLVEQGPTREILRRARHPYARGLIAAVPRFDPSRAELRPIPGSPPTSAERPEGCWFAPRCPHADETCLGQEPPEIDGVMCWRPLEEDAR
ncbi:ABC transporter ATP-binding protein [Streptosporangium sp. CA-115845]|uniref:ABC transporter ATP-binding protein n=1 Tax=Streptosporangium sp. CA-115845 TaxID=3240071 RepID=UPI003D94B182